MEWRQRVIYCLRCNDLIKEIILAAFLNLNFLIKLAKNLMEVIDHN